MRTVADTAVPNGFHRRPGSEMLDDRIVPVFAILVTEDDVMCRHGDVGIGRLQIVGQFDSFAESGLGEMDMVNVGAGGAFCAATMDPNKTRPNRRVQILFKVSSKDCDWLPEWGPTKQADYNSH